MCGIVGIINFEAAKEKVKYSSSLCKAFDDMLWADTLRGTDGTGVMALNQKKQIEILKVAGDYEELVGHKRSSEIMNWVDTAYWTIGHNRYATKGKNSEKNSHPFQSGHISLVHNGTLTYIDEKYGHQDPEHDVDSKALTNLIADIGFEKAVHEFEGAYAIVWWDDKEKTLNWARNAERPLAFINYEGGMGIASEIYLPAWCLSRNGFKVETLTYAEVHNHYKIHIDNLQEIIKTPYTPPPKKHYYRGYGGAYNGYQEDEYQAYWNKTYNFQEKGGWQRLDTLNTNKPPKKEKMRKNTNGILNGRYSDGKSLRLRINKQTRSGKSDFSYVTGSIIDDEMELIAHKVVGNCSLPIDVIGDFNNTFTATIVSIFSNQKGEYIINVKDILKEDPAQRGLLLLPSRSSTNDDTSGAAVTPCDACEQLFKPSEILESVFIRHFVEGGTVTKIYVCKHCKPQLELDPDTFKAVADSKKRYPRFFRHNIEEVLQ